MIDPDAVRGVLHALASDLEDVGQDATDRRIAQEIADEYVDRIVALAEQVGQCGDFDPLIGASCDIDAGHRGQHSGLAWPPANYPGEVVQAYRAHWGGGPDRKRIERAVGPVLFNVSNCPDAVQAHAIGRDFSRLRQALVDALVEAGLR